MKISRFSFWVMKKHFPENNLMIVYPRQFERSDDLEIFDNASTEPLSKSISAIEKLGKSIRSIYKKKV